MLTLPKLAPVGVNVSPAWTPVPVTGITASVDCGPEIVRLPDTVSFFAGANVTLRELLCPALSVKGVVRPLTVTSLAPTVIFEIVRSAFPELVRLMLFVSELPALMLPKETLFGDADSVTVAATPVPARVTFAGESGALLTICTVPFRFAAVVGANTALNEVLVPAASVVGVVSPFTLKPVPVAVSCEIVRDALPVFVSVKLCDFVWPSTTEPKLKVLGETFKPG